MKQALNKKLYLFTLIFTIGTFFLLSLSQYQDIMIVNLLRILFASIFMLFLPGYYVSLCAFREKEIDQLERFALSFALSISIIPLASFYLNLIGLPLNQWSVFAISLFVVAISIVYLHVKNKKGTQK